VDTGAAYPVLRVFASWPEDPELERSLEYKEPPDGEGALDPDPHPAATLHLKNFEVTSRKFDTNWFLGHAEERITLEAQSKRENTGYVLRPRKKPKLLADVV